MVLNDGTTYSDLTGCKIVWFDDHIADEDLEPRLAQLQDEENLGNCEVITTFH